MPLPFDPDRFAAAAARFTAFFNELGRTYVEREDVLAQVALALLCREHVLMSGPPGTAKSQVASAVLGRIVDETSGAPSLFARQFTESTVQTDLIGPLNFKTLMDTGRTEHFTDEGMLGAVHAFLDEVFDGRDMLLRSALNVLNERELKQGTRTTRGQIECAIMTTNRYLAEVLEDSRETLLAFVDRIAFLSFVPKGFASPTNLGLVLRRQLSGAGGPRFESSLTIQDLDTLQAATDSVEVPDAVCDGLVSFLHSLDEELAAALRADPSYVASRYLSVRTAVRAGRVLRAICVYDKLFRSPDRALEVQQSDFLGLRLHLILTGPSPDAIATLLSRESDPRERRQLGIVRTEREIFDRCLQKLPPIARATPKSEQVNVAKLKKAVNAALPASDPDKLIAVTRDLIAVVDSSQPGAEQAGRLLRQTVAALSARALRVGITAGVASDKSLEETVSELSSLADGLEKTASSARPLARWLRGRAVALIEDAAAAMPTTGAGALEALIGETTSMEDVAQYAEGRVARMEGLGTTRAKLRAQGADTTDRSGSDASWARSMRRLEDETVVLWDTVFRAAVTRTLSTVPTSELGKVLQWLGPTFEKVDALGARLGALESAAPTLKVRVVGPRIWPLVAAVFERLNAQDRALVISEVEALLAELKKAGLSAVVAPRDLLAWTATALVRSDRPVDAESTRNSGHEGYRTLRKSEQRVPLVYTLVEVALRVAPKITEDVGNPLEAVSAVTALLGEIPSAVRTEIAVRDLARIARSVSYLEHWWRVVVGTPPVNPEQIDISEVGPRLESVMKSGFLRVTREEAAVSRFALETRIVAEALPDHAEAAREMRERLEALGTRSTEYVNALLASRADTAWTDALRTGRGSVP